MKKFPPLLLATLLLLAACNNNKSKETTSTSGDEKEKVSTDPNGVQNAAEDIEKKKEELGKLTPMTNDQMKALLPETLLGTASRDKYVADREPKLATANFRMNDSAYMTLSIYDCAGSEGADMYSEHQAELNTQEERKTESNYSKTIDFNGGKAREACDKLYDNCSLSYFAGGRYLVVIQETHLGVEVLKQAASELSLK